MSLARKALFVSCIAAAAISAQAAPTGGTGYTLYASTEDPAGGFEYVRFVPDNVVLGHLDHALLSGFFYHGDYSKEYALDDEATLVTVDTRTAAVTPIGSTFFSGWTHLSIASDSADLGYALVAETPCDETLLYAVDLNSALPTLIGSATGCLEAGMFATDGTYYAIDSATSALVDVNHGTIGPLGFTVGSDSTLFQIAGSPIIYLAATNVNTQTMNLYDIDTATGLATLIAPFSSTPGAYTGIAIGPALPDDVFADGFDG